MKSSKSRVKKVSAKKISIKSSSKAKAGSDSRAAKVVKGMNKKEADRFKKVLLTVKAKMIKEFLHLKGDALNKSPKDASGDLSGYSYHLADMATDVYETDFMLRLAADEREKIYAIDEALKRIDEGIYGRCLVCSKEITKKRLDAVPETAYCLDCQEKEEFEKR